jgi:rhodanese-related sulfurtransferase
MFLAGFLAAVAIALPACVANPPQPAGRAPTITQSELLSKLERSKPDVVVLDVRTAAEFSAGHVPGARNVSHDELPERLAELAALRNKEVVLYCRSGRRTEIAEETLRKAGFTKLRHLEGDWLAWEAEKRPVERPASGPTKPR